MAGMTSPRRPSARTIRRISELSAFIDDRGRLPRVSHGDAAERSLAVWLRDTYRADAGPRQEILRLVEPFSPEPVVRRGSYKTSSDRMQELEEFLMVHGRMPSNKRPEESGLYFWLWHRSFSDTPDPALVQVLTAHGLSLPTRAGKRYRRRSRAEWLSLLNGFVDSHDHLPKSASSDEDEIALYAWFYRERRRPDAMPEALRVASAYGVR